MDGYRDCVLCPNECHVDRSRSVGVCRQGDRARIAWSGLHRGEEPPITGEKGSGMIFFTGCPLHCQYCQNRQISGSDGLNYGIDVTDEELGRLMLSLESMGASTLNLVTGTHFIPSIIHALGIARNEGFSLPVVWNSSGYESIEALSMIDPYIDIYLMDCKTLSGSVAKAFCRTPRYAEIIIPVLDWLKERHGCTDLDSMKGTILRHLVFPGTLNATKRFLKVFAERYKDAFALSLMVQFVPPLEDPGFPKMTDDEYQELMDLIDELGIDEGFVQERGDDDILWIPDFTKDVPFPEPFADANGYFLSLKHR
ncbi:MAG: radical SAM protein [Candidatus Ornithospirochaeta sp.]|nr:radical SAM protein [Candidatus Ornithospirochaeta sp.]